MDNRKAKVLVVDDSEFNRALLREMLDEYEVLEASSGEMALRMIWEYGQDIVLMLLDIVMPEMDGFAVLEKMNQEKWMIESIPVIIVSVEQDARTLNRAFELGVTDFIPRPYNEMIVKKRVQNTIMIFAKQKQLEGMVSNEIYENVKRSSMLIMVLSHIVEFRNHESSMHVVNINAITRALLKQLERDSEAYPLSDSEITDITIASSLHDLGKIVISDEILNKPGKLTKEEFEIVKTHARAGADLLHEIPFGQEDNLMKMCYQICRWHHERYDGKGYPDGLTGDEIPIAAQVVGLADVYDALTSEYVYKPPYTHEQAVSMITNGECGMFNPILMDCFHKIEAELPDIIRVQAQEFCLQDDVQEITQERYGNIDMYDSQRTVRQLEYEQNKVKFYASITNDILFDYTFTPSILTISEHGSVKLGLPTLVYNPEHNEQILSIIDSEDAQKLVHKVLKLGYDNQRVRMELPLNINGRKEWHRIIVKPVFRRDGSHTISGMLGVLTNINQEYKKMLLLEQRATTDSMTKLMNKGTMEKTIRSLLKTHDEKTRYGMMILDVDNLKYINDSRGHQAGDVYLRLVASQMRDSIRAEDLTGRIGGDEFMIFFRYDSRPELVAYQIYNRIMNIDHITTMSTEAEKLIQEMDFSVSAGFATVEDVGWSYGRLFKAADEALYQAKNCGKRNCKGYQR